MSHLFGWSYPAGAEYDPNAPYNQADEEDREAEEQDERLWLAGQEMLAACLHETHTVSALDWLSALLSETECLPNNSDDPEAMWTAIQASRELLESLRAACRKACQP